MIDPRDADPRHVGDADQAYQDGYIAGEYVAGLRSAPSLRRGLLIIAAWVFVGMIFGFVAGRASAASRAGLDPPAPAQLEAPHDEAIPGTPGIEPATTSDPAQQAAVGASPFLEGDGGGVSSAGLAQGRTGVIAQSVIGGPNYLAIPIGPGHLVDVCGPADCWRTVSTDAGPARSMLVQGRIADVAIGHWLEICGLPAIRGTCRGSWHVVGGPTPTLPATDR